MATEAVFVSMSSGNNQDLPGDAYTVSTNAPVTIGKDPVATILGILAEQERKMSPQRAARALRRLKARAGSGKTPRRQRRRR